MGFKFGGIQLPPRPLPPSPPLWHEIENLSSGIGDTVNTICFRIECPNRQKYYKGSPEKNFAENYRRNFRGYFEENTDRLKFLVEHIVVVLKNEIRSLPNIKYDSTLFYIADDHTLKLKSKDEDTPYKIELSKMVYENRDAFNKLYEEYTHNKAKTLPEALRCAIRIPGTRKAKGYKRGLKGKEVFCDWDELPVDEYNYKRCPKCEYADWPRIKIEVLSKQSEYQVKLFDAGMFEKMSEFDRSILVTWNWYNLSKNQKLWLDYFHKKYGKVIQGLPDTDMENELEILETMKDLKYQYSEDFYSSPQYLERQRMIERAEEIDEMYRARRLKDETEKHS